MPFNDGLLSAAQLHRSDVPPKGAGRRRKGNFRLKANNDKLFEPISGFPQCRVLHRNRALRGIAPSTTSRISDGMSFLH